MRVIWISLAIVAALGASARGSTTIYDSNGFEGFASGAIAGQAGWVVAPLDASQPDVPANVTANAPLGHGHALVFDGVKGTQSGAGIAFNSNLADDYKYVSVEFSFLQDGDGLANNLLWFGTGPASTPWYGMAWNHGGAPPAQLLPAGFAAPGTQQTPGRWTSIRVDYDLADGLDDEYVNGSPLAIHVCVGTDSAFTGWAFADQYDSATAATGQRAYIDDFRVVADNAPIVPEPNTLALLLCGTPFFMFSRRGVGAASPEANWQPGGSLHT